jgi:hypothetical protein
VADQLEQQIQDGHFELEEEEQVSDAPAVMEISLIG